MTPPDPMAGRSLLIFPILHTPADMGSLAEPLRAKTERRHGKSAWTDRIALSARRWSAIEAAIRALDLPFDRVRLYQDGLPICGRELEIVSELASKGSRNHRLLHDLIARGATLEGTEPPELLRREYDLMKKVVASKNERQGASPAQLRHEGEELLKQRDSALSRRIGETLQPGEIGILFIGLLHHPESELATDIMVKFPLNRLL